jgi:hypothetical protein
MRYSYDRRADAEYLNLSPDVGVRTRQVEGMLRTLTQKAETLAHSFANTRYELRNVYNLWRAHPVSLGQTNEQRGLKKMLDEFVQFQNWLRAAFDGAETSRDIDDLYRIHYSPPSDYLVWFKSLEDTLLRPMYDLAGSIQKGSRGAAFKPIWQALWNVFFQSIDR